MGRIKFHPIVLIIAIIVLIAIAPFAWNRWFADDSSQQDKQFLTYVDRGIDPEDMHIFDDRIAELEAEIEAKGERDIGLLLILGNVYFALGDLAQAEEFYLDILSTNPNDAAALENLARTKEDMLDYEAAESYYRQAMAVFPRTQTYLWLSALIHDQYPERQSEIRLILEEGVDRVGQTTGLMVALGNWYRENDMLDEAISHYRIAVQLAPEDTSIKEELDALMQLRSDQAERDMRK